MRKIAMIALGQSDIGERVQSALERHKTEVVTASPEGIPEDVDGVIVAGGATPDALDDAVRTAAGSGCPVLALFTLTHGVPFRIRREDLLALGASDATEEQAPDDDLVTRIRALMLQSLAPRVLLVEDEEKIARWVIAELAADGIEVTHAASLEAAREVFGQGPVDAVITDRMLPDGDGLEFVSQLRGRGISLPVLVYSALTDVEERVRGLEQAGANDYLCKPAHADELRVRLRVLLRPRETESTLRFGPMEIVRTDRIVRWRGTRVALRPRETDVLIYLAERAGLSIPQQMLYADVWEKTYMEPGSNPVAAVKHRLVTGFRKAFPEDVIPSFVEADGNGYCFDPAPLLRLDEENSA